MNRPDVRKGVCVLMQRKPLVELDSGLSMRSLQAFRPMKVGYLCTMID